jgi:hypothetical protein
MQHHLDRFLALHENHASIPLALYASSHPDLRRRYREAAREHHHPAGGIAALWARTENLGVSPAGGSPPEPGVDASDGARRKGQKDRTVPLPGHGDMKTTMIYLQTVPSVTLKEARSPLDL